MYSFDDVLSLSSSVFPFDLQSTDMTSETITDVRRLSSSFEIQTIDIDTRHTAIQQQKRQSSSNNQLRHITSASKRPNETMMMSKRRTWEDFSSSFSSPTGSCEEHECRSKNKRQDEEKRKIKAVPVTEWMSQRQTQRETRVEPISATSHFHFIPLLSRRCSTSTI